MGSDNKPISKQSHRQHKDKETSVSQHPRFVDAIQVQGEDKNTYFQVSMSIANISIYKMWQKHLQQIKSQIHGHSLLLPLHCQYQQEGLCGSAGILKLEFEHYPFLLSQQISNRKLQNLQFQDNQLWFLLYILVQTSALAHGVNLTIGDIRPGNIFINSTGDIALFNVMTFPEESTNYQKITYFREPTYIPPQATQDLITGKEMPSYDQKVGESFSIGLTILDALLLTNHSAVYQKNFILNQDALTRSIQVLKSRQINEVLKQIITSMLQFNPNNRITCQQLYQFLKPYQDNIFELESFKIQQPLPSKLQKNPNQTPKHLNNISRQKISSAQNVTSAEQISLQKLNDIDTASNKRPTRSQGLQRVYETSNEIFQSQVNRVTSPFNYQQFRNKDLPNEVDQPLRFQTGSGNKNILNNKQTVKKATNIVNTINTQSYKEQTPQFSKIVTVQSQFKRQVVEPSKLMFKTGNLFQQGRTDTIYQNQKNTFQISHQPGYKIQQPAYKMQQPSSVVASSSANYSDFLKNIDRQLQESRKLFPDSFI